MTSPLSLIRRWLFPPIPEAIRDDFSVLRAERIRSQSPLLFITLFLTTPTAIYGASPGLTPFISIGFPLLMGAACLVGFIVLLSQRHIPIRPRVARRMISETTWVSGSLAVVCSIWCVTSWLTAPPELRIYYPMIVSMGSLATAYCLSTMRWATVVNLGIGLLPMSVLLFTSGNRLDLAAGTSLFVASAFLFRLILQQHGQLVDLLMLQRQMRELAATDPLTGLLNRRAFDDRVTQAIETADETPFTVALLDLDGFKPVNDRFGHAMGDRLLCEVAHRLVQCGGSNVAVGRFGGDEFAILVPAGSRIDPDRVADHFLTVLIAPYRIDGGHIRIGASIGVSCWPQDGRGAAELFREADRRLYAAKAENKMRDIAQPERTVIAA